MSKRYATLDAEQLAAGVKPRDEKFIIRKGEFDSWYWQLLGGARPGRWTDVLQCCTLFDTVEEAEHELDIARTFHAAYVGEQALVDVVEAAPLVVVHPGPLTRLRKANARSK